MIIKKELYLNKIVEFQDLYFLKNIEMVENGMYIIILIILILIYLII